MPNPLTHAYICSEFTRHPLAVWGSIFPDFLMIRGAGKDESHDIDTILNLEKQGHKSEFYEGMKNHIYVDNFAHSTVIYPHQNRIYKEIEKDFKPKLGIKQLAGIITEVSLDYKVNEQTNIIKLIEDSRKKIDLEELAYFLELFDKKRKKDLYHLTKLDFNNFISIKGFFRNLLKYRKLPSFLNNGSLLEWGKQLYLFYLFNSKKKMKTIENHFNTFRETIDHEKFLDCAIINLKSKLQ